MRQNDQPAQLDTGRYAPIFGLLRRNELLLTTMCSILERIEMRNPLKWVHFSL